MHELAICQGLMAQVQAVAAKNGARSVERVVLSVGPLSGLEPQLLERAFTVAQAGTLAAKAKLEIRCGPVRVCCSSCGVVSEASPNRLLCESCGDWKVKLTEGDELILISMELSGFGLDSKPGSSFIPVWQDKTGIQ